MPTKKKATKKKQSHKVTDRFKETKNKIGLAMADLVKAEMQLRALLPRFAQLNARERERIWNWMCKDIENFDVTLDDYCDLLPHDCEEPEEPKSKPPTSLGDLPPLGSIFGGIGAGILLSVLGIRPPPYRYGPPPGYTPPVAPPPPVKADSIDVEYKRVEPERKRLKNGEKA